jgi:hypothetical protein
MLQEAKRGAPSSLPLFPLNNSTLIAGKILLSQSAEGGVTVPHISTPYNQPINY